MSYDPQNAKGRLYISIIPDIITLLLYSATAVTALYLIHSSYLLVSKSKTSFSLSFDNPEPTYPRFVGTWKMDYKTVKGNKTTFFIDPEKRFEGGFYSRYLGDDWKGHWKLRDNEKGKKVLTIYEYRVPKNELDAPDLFWTYSVILDDDELGGEIIGTGGERIQLHRK